MNHLFLQEIRFLWDRLDPDSYVYQIPALMGRDSITFDHNITFFAGENGSGKSTLLEAIAVSYGFNYEETESYQVTDMFLNQREYFLKKLLSD